MSQAEFLSLLARSSEARLSGNLSEALLLACEANGLMPGEPAAYHTVALALSDLGEHNRAFSAWEEAVRHFQDADTLPGESLGAYQKVVFGFACSLLRRGEWKRAWPYWEAGRILAAWGPFPGTEPWQGETDGNLLVLPEGGYGDLFCFSRFLPLLRIHENAGIRNTVAQIAKYEKAALFPNAPLSLSVGIRSLEKLKTKLESNLSFRVGLCLRPETVGLRDWTSLGVEEVHEIGSAIPIGKYKYSTSLLSLPGLLGIDSPSEVPPDVLPKHAAFPNGGQPRIGFCWRAEEAGEQNGRKVRTLPIGIAEEIAAKLSGCAGADVFDLCPGHTRIPGLIHEENRMETWTATMDYLAGMDLVLTVDTAVAHLAGLLGLDTLCLLPLNSDWKWLLGREDTVWYPPNFRLFQNRTVAWQTEQIVEAALTALSATCATRLPRLSCHSKTTRSASP